MKVYSGEGKGYKRLIKKYPWYLGVPWIERSLPVAGRNNLDWGTFKDSTAFVIQV